MVECGPEHNAVAPRWRSRRGSKPSPRLYSPKQDQHPCFSKGGHLLFPPSFPGRRAVKRRVLALAVLCSAAALALAAWWWTRPSQPADPSSRGSRSRAVSDLELPSPGPAAPEGLEAGDFDNPFRFGAGHSITLRDYRETADLPDGSLVADLLEVEVCAGDRPLVGGALPAAFALGYPVRGGRFEVRTGASQLDAGVSALAEGLRGEVVEAGECRDGWVAFVLGEEGRHDRRPAASIVFDNTAYGFVPESDRARHAWRLPSP